jgi:DNA-binding protein WhiA
LLGGGSLSGPRGAHLELRSAEPEGAAFLARLAADDGVQLRVADRGRHAVAYAKGIDAIAGVLALAGAGRAVLVFEETAVMSATRSHANRLANADHANLVRTSRAAHEQLRAVQRLRRTGDFAQLPERLQEIAELRELHPTLPLRELALKCRPPATKAAVHRRLQKLQQLAGI